MRAVLHLILYFATSGVHVRILYLIVTPPVKGVLWLVIAKVSHVVGSVLHATIHSCYWNI